MSGFEFAKLVGDYIENDFLRLGVESMQTRSGCRWRCYARLHASEWTDGRFCKGPDEAIFKTLDLLAEKEPKVAKAVRAARTLDGAKA